VSGSAELFLSLFRSRGGIRKSPPSFLSAPPQHWTLRATCGCHKARPDPCPPPQPQQPGISHPCLLVRVHLQTRGPYMGPLVQRGCSFGLVSELDGGISEGSTSVHKTLVCLRCRGPEAASGTQSWQNMAGLPAQRTRGLTTFSISQPTRRH
jgi:hypothetical protein